MALSIGVEKNSRVQIGPDVLTVVDVLGVASIAVRLNNGPTLTLTANVKTELVPTVVAYCGVNAQRKNQQARIAIEAPRDVRIERLD